MKKTAMLAALIALVQAGCESATAPREPLSDERRGEFLSSLDRATRNKVADMPERDGLTDADKALLRSRLGVENGARAEAIARALRSIPPEDHAQWFAHWEEIGVITPTVRRQLRDLGVTVR